MQVAFYIAIIGAVTAPVGTQVLKFFGISIHDLHVAGGMVVLSVAVVFALGGKCSKYLSNTARAIMNRVMGPIPVALVVQMIIDGLKVLLSGLAGS